MAKRETPGNTFMLDDLTRATRRRLGPTRFVIGEDLKVDLPSIFRLPKKTRDKVWKAIKELDDLSDADDNETESYQLLTEAISDILREITPDAEALLEALNEAADGDPLLAASLLGDILGKWMEHTQAGEA
jgi:tail assembly protein